MRQLRNRFFLTRYARHLEITTPHIFKHILHSLINHLHRTLSLMTSKSAYKACPP